MSEPAERPLITTPDGLRELVDHLRSARRFAFDTEFVSEDTYEPVLCLVQVATLEQIVAIDSMAVRDLAPFWEVASDPSIEVVMHAAGEDLRICKFQTGRVPSRVFDVQIAAGLVGFGYPLSLGNLVSQVLRQTVFGGETRTDWRKRPLSPAQLRYALDDVRYLLPVADHIREKLRHLDREAWAEEELRGFLDEIQNRDDESRWRRLSGLHHLNRRGLEVARRLAAWRAGAAKKANRPLRQLLRDDLLVAIARRQPTTRADLEALRDFNRPNLVSKGHEILALVEAVQSVPAEELPEHNDRHEEGAGLTMIVNVLAAALATCCAEKKVATGLVGSTSDLKALVRWQAQNRPESERPGLATGWREKVCGETLLAVLSGRSSVRIVDLDSDVPVAVARSSEQPDS